MRYPILIVDDSATDRYLLKRMIKETQLETHIVEKANGVEALAFLQDQEQNKKIFGADYPPIICFLDINMPHMDGWDFLSKFSKVREKLGLTSLTIIMFSSSNNIDQQNKAAQFDCVAGYIVKGEATTIELSNAIMEAA